MRVILVEDQALLREGLAGLFRDAGHDVVASARRLRRPRRGVRRSCPDVVVLDVRLPPTYTDEGTRAAAALKRPRPGIGVLLLSQHIETAHSVRPVAAGRVRLPAQGPGAGRRRIPVRCRSRGRRRVGAGPPGGRRAAQSQHGGGGASPGSPSGSTTCSGSMAQG